MILFDLAEFEPEVRICYNFHMIRIIAGGKRSSSWCTEACFEYEKRLRKPYEITWEFIDEERLAQKLAKWPFTSADYVICCDERGQNISSPEFSEMLEDVFLDGKNVIILIGGAYGFTDEVRKRSDFVWSFSKLVFPHMIARLIAVEQIYRASQIVINGPYHHE